LLENQRTNQGDGQTKGTVLAVGFSFFWVLKLFFNCGYDRLNRGAKKCQERREGKVKQGFII